MVSDKEIKVGIGTLLQAGSDPTTRVLTRWKLSIENHDWKGALRSLTNNNKIDGWFISRVSRHSHQVAINKWELIYIYALCYFRSVREGTALSNSEDEVNELLDRVAEQFERNRTIGFDEEDSGVDCHEDLQITDIGVIEDQVHFAQCELTVNLTKQF